VVPLAWGENGYRELTNSKRPIKSPADLKGMKIRVVGSPCSSDTFTALGANPTQMSWADAQPALASGAVDGQENPLFLFTPPSCTPWARSTSPCGATWPTR
jgi:TRAP-type C4-dicarboxylate transport system substrate-binding protein